MGWWNNDYDSSWDRVKDAFKRDWEQTKHDFGSDEARDLDQDVDDTVKQAMGFEDRENAFRYGYGARQHFGGKDWDNDLENNLRTDYQGDWNRDRSFIRHGYRYSG